MSSDSVIYDESGSFRVTNAPTVDGKRSPIDAVSRKRIKVEDTLESLKQALLEMHKAILFKLECIEDNIANVVLRCKRLEEKIEAFSLDSIEKFHAKNQSVDKVKTLTSFIIDNSKSSADSISENNAEGSKERVVKPNDLDTAVKLNREEDYPNGTWLGDENDAEARVRCCITPRDLFLINASCLTPKKLALTLLDFLFDRETQACSNISGYSKHGKKQLNPLLVFGILCQLKSRFNISEKVWSQIKKSLDSKCRTAYQRKQRGMSLRVKAFQDRLFQTPYENLQGTNDALTSFVTDQHSDAPGTSSIKDPPELCAAGNCLDIQEDMSHALDECNTNGSVILKQEVKSESNASLADRPSDAPCTSIIRDLPELCATGNPLDIQENSHHISHTLNDCNTNASDLVKQEVQNESGASLIEDQQCYHCEDASSSCANQNIVTCDHKDAALSYIDDSAFNLIGDAAIIDIEHPESQIIHTTIGDVKVVHAIRHQLVNMESDGRVMPYITDVDIIIQPPTEH